MAGCSGVGMNGVEMSLIWLQGWILVGVGGRCIQQESCWT